MRTMFMWFTAQRTFVGCPQMGKITPEAMEWARNFDKTIDKHPESV